MHHLGETMKGSELRKEELWLIEEHQMYTIIGNITSNSLQEKTNNNVLVRTHNVLVRTHNVQLNPPGNIKIIVATQNMDTEVAHRMTDSSNCRTSPRQLAVKDSHCDWMIYPGFSKA